MEDIFIELRRADDRISLIQKELKSSLVKPDVLLDLAKELRALESFIKKVESEEQGPFLKSEIEKHRVTLIQLFGRWHTLFVDAEVTQIAEDAQKLLEGKASTTDLKALETHIKDLCIDEALSIENQLMITLAKRFLAKAMGKLANTNDRSFAPTSGVEVHDITTHLFEIASELYEGSVTKGTNLFYLLSEDIKRDVLMHFQNLNGNMSAFNERDMKAVHDNAFKLIQALLATVKEIAQGISDPTYLDAEEVDAILSSTDSIM